MQHRVCGRGAGGAYVACVLSMLDTTLRRLLAHMLWRGVAQEFVFDDDTEIGGGETLTIWSGKRAKSRCNAAGDGNLWWTNRFIWNNDGDTAVLVDAGGDEVSVLAGSPVRITDLDLIRDTVTITNTSDRHTISLSGWTLLSDTGSQVRLACLPVSCRSSC